MIYITVRKKKLNIDNGFKMNVSYYKLLKCYIESKKKGMEMKYIVSKIFKCLIDNEGIMI